MGPRGHMGPLPHALVTQKQPGGPAAVAAICGGSWRCRATLLLNPHLVCRRSTTRSSSRQHAVGVRFAMAKRTPSLQRVNNLSNSHRNAVGVRVAKAKRTPCLNMVKSRRECAPEVCRCPVCRVVSRRISFQLIGHFQNPKAHPHGDRDIVGLHAHAASAMRPAHAASMPMRPWAAATVPALAGTSGDPGLQQPSRPSLRGWRS